MIELAQFRERVLDNSDEGELHEGMKLQVRQEDTGTDLVKCR